VPWGPLSLGFESASLRCITLSVRWRVPTADFFFEAERRAGVRTAALLARQTAERLAAIRRRMTAEVAEFGEEGVYALPMTANLVTATRR